MTDLREDRQRRPLGKKVLQGALAGVVAGVVASFAMDRFQAAVSALSTSDSGSEPATEQAADAIATWVAGRKVPDSDKPLAGQAIHYALGIGLGVAYAVTAEFRPAVTAGRGVVFGLATATLLDEAAVPVVGLGEAPWKAEVSTTAYSYVSHLVFATVAELVRDQVRETLTPEK